MNSLSDSLPDHNILRFIFETLRLFKMKYFIYPHKNTCPLHAALFPLWPSSTNAK